MSLIVVARIVAQWLTDRALASSDDGGVDALSQRSRYAVLPQCAEDRVCPWDEYLKDPYDATNNPNGFLSLVGALCFPLMVFRLIKHPTRRTLRTSSFGRILRSS